MQSTKIQSSNYPYVLVLISFFSMNYTGMVYFWKCSQLKHVNICEDRTFNEIQKRMIWCNQKAFTWFYAAFNIGLGLNVMSVNNWVKS